MKCQYCNQNDASLSFHINFMGHLSEIHLCEECAERLRRYASLMPDGMWQPPPTSPVPPTSSGPQVRRELGQDPFPQDAGDEIRRRREVSSLKARLLASVETEDYEEAARLRDQITALETEVCSYGL